MDDNNQPTGNSPAENTDLAKQYQEILDQYSQELASKPTPDAVPEPEIPTTVPLTELPPPPPPVSPEPESLIPPSPPVVAKPTFVSQPTSSSSGGFFKVLFFISLLIFLGVCGAILFTVISSKQNGANTATPTPVSSTTPTVSTAICQLNDKTFPVGLSFWAADNCNTCTCMPDLTISCTTKVCEATPSGTITPTKSATSSAIPASWKTYTNSTFGLSFKYPSDYKATILNGAINLQKNSTRALLYLSESDNPSSLDISQWFDSQPKEDIQPIKDTSTMTITTVNGQKALKFTKKQPETGYKDFLVIVGNKTNVYYLNFGPLDNEVDISNQILSTFKFL